MTEWDKIVEEAQTAVRHAFEAGDEMADRIEELEAKLDKAVEALRFYAPQTVGGITFLGGDDAGKRAAAVLAELEVKE